MDDTDMKMVVTQGEDDCRKAEYGLTVGEQLEAVEKLLSESQEKFLFFKDNMESLLGDLEELVGEVGSHLSGALTALNDFSNLDKANIYINLADFLNNQILIYIDHNSPEEVLNRKIKDMKPEGMFIE